MTKRIQNIIVVLFTQEKSLSLRLSYGIIILLCTIGVFGKFIANDIPIMGKIDNKIVFPVFKDLAYDLQIIKWPDRYKYQQIDGNYSFIVPTPIPYSSNYIDNNNAGFISPFQKQDVSSLHKRHWLGTDQLGRDVFAGLIQGCRVSLLISFFTCLLAMIIGIPLGLFAGYYGDNGFRLSRFTLIIVFLLLFTLGYFLIYSNTILLPFISILCISGSLIFLSEKYLSDKNKWTVPIDSIIVKLIELFKSIPALIILFVFLGMMTSTSMWNIVLCLGFLTWFNIARYIRAELLNIREQDFIMAQKSIGQKDYIIIFKHCLKHAIQPVLISVVFLFASVILLESTLSFLGIGLPADSVSWGSMLSEARKYFSAWWLAIFPGLAILLSIISLHTIAQNWIKKLNPKLN